MGNSSEPRKTFHQELDELKKQVLKMGELVEESIHNAVKALVNEDMGLAEEVVQGDDAIDELTEAIEEHSLAIQARQSPVASDLRLIYSIQFISIHLERMGDYASNLARAAERSHDEPRIQSLLDIITEMGELTCKVVNASLKAFEKKDLELAQQLPVLDDPIDDLFKKFFKEVTIQCEEKTLDWAINMILVNRYLERIADHAVDIGERICYLITGEMKQLD